MLSVLLIRGYTASGSGGSSVTPSNVAGRSNARSPAPSLKRKTPRSLLTTRRRRSPVPTQEWGDPELERPRKAPVRRGHRGRNECQVPRGLTFSGRCSAQARLMPAGLGRVHTEERPRRRHRPGRGCDNRKVVALAVPKVAEPAAAILDTDGPDPQFLHSVLRQVSLPRNPTRETMFTRSCGQVSITLQAGPLFDGVAEHERRPATRRRVMGGDPAERAGGSAPAPRLLRSTAKKTAFMAPTHAPRREQVSGIAGTAWLV